MIKLKEAEINGAGRNHEGDEKYIQNFVRATCREETT
jgi:hypothetical protein